MTDFLGTTASSGVKVTDPEKVKELIEKYHIDTGIELGPDGILRIYGHDWFAVWDEETLRQCCTDEFLEELRQYIPPQEKLIIQSVGHEGCRYPLSAQEIVVTREDVRYSSFTCGGETEKTDAGKNWKEDPKIVEFIDLLKYDGTTIETDVLGAFQEAESLEEFKMIATGRLENLIKETQATIEEIEDL
jgi:hypothetical protein